MALKGTLPESDGVLRACFELWGCLGVDPPTAKQQCIGAVQQAHSSSALGEASHSTDRKMPGEEWWAVAAHLV